MKSFTIAIAALLAQLAAAKDKDEPNALGITARVPSQLSHTSRKLSGCTHETLVDLIGDKDEFGQGLGVGDISNVVAFLGPGDPDGITDKLLTGDIDYKHMVDVSSVAHCHLIEATLEIVSMAQGSPLFFDVTKVMVDGVMEGSLTPSGFGFLGSFGIVRQDFIDVMIANAMDGAAMVEIDTFFKIDFWVMDYSELTLKYQCGNCGGGAGGDPHFLRWHHTKREPFHGECDMVLFHKEKFNQAKNEDLDVHIRTTATDAFSYIDSAAIKVGEDVLYFEGKKFYLNKEKRMLDSGESLHFGSDATYSVIRHNDEKNEKNRIYTIDVGDASVTVRATDQFMHVSVEGTDEAMGGSVGMLGDFNNNGEMVARDGSIMDDFTQFGYEWQVNPLVDPVIFGVPREPQLPYEKCRMPTGTVESKMKRKLRSVGGNGFYEKALTACQENHTEDNVQSCMEDVMLTGNLDLANAW